MAKEQPNSTVFDGDEQQPLLQIANKLICSHIRVQNMSSATFFKRLAAADKSSERNQSEVGEGKAVYYFGKVPQALRGAVQPDRALYDDMYDFGRKEQYLWLSSEGPQMHTHFDQDKNVFLQVYGKKEFRMFPPEAHRRLSLFPRTHPLWHKSQVDWHAPHEAFPDARFAEGLLAKLGAGDMLYVPPFYMHHVTSASASISLSTWSKYVEAFEAMASAYGRGCSAQQLPSLRARAWALQYYVHKLAERVYGPGSVDEFALSVLSSRFRSAAIRQLFPLHEEATLLQNICGTASEADGGHVAWVSTQLKRDLDFDVEIAWNSFKWLHDHHLPVFDTLLSEFVEQIVCDSLDCTRLHAFFSHCLRSDVVYRTDDSLDERDEQGGHVGENGERQEEEEEDMTEFDPSIWDEFQPQQHEAQAAQPTQLSASQYVEHTRCEVCRKAVHSDLEAQVHYKETGHINFERYDPALDLEET